MDPLTHALAGAAAAHATSGGRLGRLALAIGAAAALLPDVDVLIRSAADPLLAIEYHRHFTHSLVVAPLGGVLAALPWLASRRGRENWRWTLLAALVAYTSHGLLDASTSFGTLLLWPSTQRVAWHAVSIIEPPLTLLLAGGVGLAAHRRSRLASLGVLLFVLGYLGVGVVQRERAFAAQQELGRSRGHLVRRAAVLPTVGNRLVWRSLYEADGRLHLDRLRVPWRGSSQFRPGTSVPRLAGVHLPPGAVADPRVRRDVERSEWIADGWLAPVPGAPGAIGDARYSLRNDAFEPVWAVRFQPGATVPTEWIDRSRERELELGALWREVTGAEGYRPLGEGGQD
jgi:inner membrane protein